MALRFVDSFDDRDTTHLVAKYNAALDVNVQIDAAGRNGTSGCKKNGSDKFLQKSLNSEPEWIVGMAVYLPSFVSLGGRNICTFSDSGTSQCYFDIAPTGHLRFYAPAGLIGSSSAPLSLNTWHYVEFKVLIDNAGSAEARIDEVVVYTVAVDTQATASSSANAIQIAAMYENLFVDDLYICDANDGIHDNYLGDNRVECILPNGAGAPATAEWVSSGGGASVFGNVDDNPPDDDATYNYRDAAGLPLKDVWAFPAIASASGIINGVQINTLCRKDDAGVVSMEHVTRSGGADYNSASFNVPTGGYVYESTVRDQDPNGPINWTVANVNLAEFGYRRSA